MWAHFQKIVLKPVLLSVSEPAAWVSTEMYQSISIHPTLIPSQCAASRASTITMFHLQQLRLNLSLSAFIVFLRLSLSVLITVDCCCQVFSIVFVVVIGCFFILSSVCLFPVVTNQPVVPLTEVHDLAQALAMSQTEKSSSLIGWQVWRCPILGQKEAGIKLKRALKMFLTVLYFSDSCNMSPIKNQHMWFC